MREIKRYHEFKNGVVENEHGMFVKHQDYAALQQKLDAVLAENVALKNYLQECSVVQGEGNWTSDAEKSFYVPATEWLPPTPGTYVLLNAVRAEGVEMFAKHCDDSIGFIEPEDDDFYTLMEEQARLYAAQLRTETDTTPSQYESLAGGK